MSQLLNHMMLAINRSQMNIGYAQLGIISSVDAPSYAVKVLLQPEQIETGFIPFPTLFYGFVAPPKGGEQCLVLFERGNNNVPIPASLIYWDQSRAPGINSDGDTQPGEILLIHKDTGSYIKWTNDGKLLINGNVEIDITTPILNITTTGNVTLSAGGNLSANIAGDANINTTGQATLKGATTTITGGTVTLGDGTTAEDALVKYTELKTAFDAHVHPDPQGGDTGTPTNPLPSTVATTVVSGA